MPQDAPEIDPAALAVALARLRGDGDHDAADALLAHVKGGGGVVGKAMSSLVGSEGGYLVSDGAVARKRRRKRLRGCIAKAMRELGGG